MSSAADLKGRRAHARQPSLRRSGGVMVAGSLVSRATGFIRLSVITAAVGTAAYGDAFGVANTVPNIIYALMIGGALQSVFIPELVRAAKEHSDGGRAYTDRLLTLCGVALLVITALAVLAAPLLVGAYAPDFTGAQRDLTVALARYCLPQILFYGLFTLLGQVLGARDRFGAMMWTPVLNNVVVIGVFGLYLGLAHGGVDRRDAMLLGLGSTAGIAVQALALLPSLRAAGFRWQPRFDWRGWGLAAPMRAAVWTLMLVLVNQLAYWVVTRLSTSAGQHALAAGHHAGVGYAAYSNAYSLWVVPQGIVTVSLVTALLPRMSRAAADGDHASIGADLSRGLKVSGTAIVPAVLAFLALGPQIAGVVFQHGATTEADARAIAWMLTAFALGLPAVRGPVPAGPRLLRARRHADAVLSERRHRGGQRGPGGGQLRTPAARWAVTGMAAGYAVACTVGLVCTTALLRRRLAWRPRVLGHHVRLAVAFLPGAALAWVTARACASHLGPTLAGDLVGLLLGAAALALPALALAKPLHLPLRPRPHA